ncbi:1-acyl-sn-glycerol-3-phosphate acyltransferase [Wenzhouxiangella sp. XN79A]|uniref:lysophospholipid acyltransferase family protein n=1 Tax=Wenzhouxiangella sp. XN79A TaxID=2724193 RepID=UPI00144AAC20|nr:lysophospholipid acyltransferase family protein [Wenzhouxiangella sp. XN79A]NKI34449.1 1-acyl-sn-glycerol-3-phosphate acyltransferase [Wenzhouxiangella sp. XN79A]
MTDVSSTSHAQSNRPGWLDRLYPLWLWLVLLPVVVVYTMIAAPLAMAVCLFGGQRFANTQIAARWARLIAQLTPVELDIEGAEHIEPGRSYVVVANHQSQYDIPVIYGYSGLDLRWVMKAEVGRIPFVAQGCRAIGHIFIDRSNPDQARAAINAAVARLDEGTGILFFPEGTRSRTGELLPFRKGAFRVAADRGWAVLPMTVIGTRDILRPGGLRIRPGRAKLIIHPPIEAKQEGDGLTIDEVVRDLHRRSRDVIASALEPTDAV